MKRIGLFFLLAIAANASAATVTLGNVSGTAGQTVTISVNLQNGGTPQLSGVQFDLIYDTTAMAITAVESDAAFAKPQRKTVASNPVAGGLRVILSGGQAVMPDENVVDLTIAINAGASTANYPLTFTGLIGTDPLGNVLALGGAGGHLTVGNPPVLSVSKTHSGNFAQGQSNATYTVTVSNAAGAIATNGAVTVTEVLPAGLSLVSMTGSNWDCSAGNSCTRSDALGAGTSYSPITVTASVSNVAPASVTNTVSVTGGGSLDAVGTDPTTIVVPQSQAITFGPLNGVNFGVAPFAVSATASSGLAVGFTSSTNTVCTLAGNTVTIVGTGTCTIIAGQGGNGTFAPAAFVPQSFTVSPGSQTITFPTPADTALNAGPVTLTATATSNLAVSFASATPAVCTVSVASVTLVTKGACTITATQAGNSNFAAAADVSKTFTVLGNSNVITFPQPADTGVFLGPVTLTATANSGLAVSYTSNSTAVCTVAGSSVSLASVGVCSITANQAGDPSFTAAAPVTRTFNILKASQTITFSALGNLVFGASAFTLAPTASSTLGVSLVSNTPQVCTMSGNTVAIVAAGTCSITATQAGDATYAAATAVTQTFTVTQATQTITFNALNPVAFGTAPFAVNATASSSLAVSFASSTSSVCTVAGNTVTLAGVGTCSIDASQAGNANVGAAATVTQSFTVGQGSQTITFGAPAGVAIGVSPFALNATASSGLAVGFASTTQSVCTVAVSTVTIVTVGTCSITASQAGNANFTAATPVSQSFTVAAAAQTITFSALPAVTFGVSPIALTATASSNLAVTFASATLPVCTVSGSTVTIVGAGACTITADQAGNASFGAAPQVSRTFTVAQAPQTITFSALNTTTFGTAPFTVSATATSNLTVSFASTTQSVCTVAGTTVTLAGLGTCTITASQAGDANNLPATSVSRSFTVNQGAQTITFNALSNVAFGSAPITLNATASSGLTVSFASTTLPVCTVSGTTLTLVAPGACSVTASQAGNANYATAVAVVQNFSVAAGTQTITFAPLNNSTVGVTPFTVSATASSNLAVSFSSTTTAVCTVAGSTVTTIAIGTCTIAANQAGNANFAAATAVTQSFTVGQGSQTITFGPLTHIALGLTPPALSATASSGLAVAFSSTTQPVCTVAGNTITLLDAGTCSITANQDGNANYTAATPVTQSFTVDPGTQTITFAPAGVAFGVAPFTLVASTTSHLALTFASTTLGVCTVVNSTVTIAAVGTCTITVSQAGNASFAPASVSKDFVVAKGAQTITFVPPANVIMGVAPFAVSATSTSGLDVAFASTSPLVCTVSGVTVTVVGAGSCSISAAQAGNVNYLAAPTVSGSFTVTPGPQTITFAPLGNVAFGVSPITLTATSSAGLTVTFSSSTPTVCTVSGATLTIVGPGNCSVTANQSGSANYSAATAVTRTFIATGTQTIGFPAISDQQLTTPPFELGATATSGLQVTYVSTTLAVCTVSGDTVTLLTVGTCSITANQTGNSIFLAGTASQSFTVLAPPPCGYTLSPVEASLAASGGSGTLKVLTGPGCAWTATSNAGFLTVTSAGSGTDTATIAYSANVNAGSARSGTLTVGGQTFTVNQFGAGCSYALSTPSLDFTAAGGSATISVVAPVSNCTWTGTPGDPAVTLSPGTATAPSQVTVSITANPNVASRSLTATIGGQSLTLNQAGKNCTVALGSQSATIPAAGGSGSVAVTTPNGCSYSTVTGPSWIGITSGGTGTAPGGTLFYTVDANSTTASRTGAMNIGGQSFQITQPGVSCEISLDTSSLGSPFAQAGGTGTIGIFTNNPACNWTASTHAAWLTFTGAATGTGPGTVTVVAAAGVTNARSALISIAGQLVNVSQAGAACTFALRSSSGGAPATGGSGSVGVVSAPGCSWTSSTNDPSWLTIDSSANTGTGDVAFTAAANNTATPRSGTLTIASQTYTVKQGGLPCDFTLALASVNAPVGGITNGKVDFTASASGCDANAVSFSNWLTVSTVLSSQAGTITYTAAVNTGPARIGTVKLGARTFSVSQAGASCTFILATPGVIFGKGGGSGSIQITASGSGCSPTATTNQAWATLGGLTGPVSNVFTQQFTVAPFSSAANAVRTATIAVGGKTYTIKQTSW